MKGNSVTFPEMLLEKQLIPYLHWTVSNDRLWVPKDFGHTCIWALPCSTMRAPIFFEREQFYLVHDGLRDHPYITLVEGVTGMTVHNLPAGRGENYLWRHAIDLVSEGEFDGLFDTRHLTTEQDIAGAIAFMLISATFFGKADLSIKQAKTLMKRFNITEPADRSHAAIRCFKAPISSKSETGQDRFTVTEGRDLSPLQRAWSTIHGIEFGWFSTTTGRLTWTQSGMDHHAGETCGLLL